MTKIEVFRSKKRATFLFWVLVMSRVPTQKKFEVDFFQEPKRDKWVWSLYGWVQKWRNWTQFCHSQYRSDHQMYKYTAQSHVFQQKMLFVPQFSKKADLVPYKATQKNERKKTKKIKKPHKTNVTMITLWSNAKIDFIDNEYIVHHETKNRTQ